MATENIRKEAFRRPNILRKRALTKAESKKDIEAGVAGTDAAPQLTILISKPYCQKRMTHQLSQTADGTFQRCTVPTIGHDDMLLDLHSRLFEEIEHNEMSMSKLNYSYTASNNAGNVCMPSLPLSSKDNNSILDNMSILQESWTYSGESQELDRLHLPLRQVESLDTELQQGKGRLRCPWPGCLLGFAWACRLRGHWRSHSGARPYACALPGCRAAFRSASKRRRHETRVAHRAPPTAPTTPTSSQQEEGGSARTHRPWSGRAGFQPSPSVSAPRSADVFA